MKPISKLALPVVTMAAALISSCGGGGGENQNYYISVQQFEGGSKAFRFIGSPSVDVMGGRGVVTSGKFELKDGFLKMMKDATENATTDNVFGDIAEQGGDTLEHADDGTVCDGTLKSGGAVDSLVEVAYCTVGGSTGRGYLYITFQSSGSNGNGALPPAMVHLMGCVVPTDVLSMPGGTGYFTNVMVNVNQAIVSSLYGAVVRAEVNFNSGMAHMGLCFQVWEREDTGDSLYDKKGSGVWRDYVSNDLPYIAIDP